MSSLETLGTIAESCSKTCSSLAVARLALFEKLATSSTMVPEFNHLYMISVPFEVLYISHFKNVHFGAQPFKNILYINDKRYG